MSYPTKPARIAVCIRIQSMAGKDSGETTSVSREILKPLKEEGEEEEP